MSAPAGSEGQAGANPFNLVWLASVALDGPVALLGLFLTQALPVIEMTNTTVVITKVSYFCIPSCQCLLLTRVIRYQAAFRRAASSQHRVPAGCRATRLPAWQASFRGCSTDLPRRLLDRLSASTTLHPHLLRPFCRATHHHAGKDAWVHSWSAKSGHDRLVADHIASGRCSQERKGHLSWINCTPV